MMSPEPEKSPPRPDGGLSEASRFWDTVLDPQNLKARGAGTGGGTGLDAAAIEREIAFAQTPDFEAARAWLAGAEGIGERPVVDLGAGLGAQAFALARAGLGPILVVDTSPARLAQLMQRAQTIGLVDRIWPLQAAAEALPLAGGSVAGVFTKSVLIHTDMPAAAAEIERVLASGGRAALVEPQTGNPFVKLYRALLAPREWKGITRYFDTTAQRIFIERFPPGWAHVVHFYVFSFFAFGFQFALPSLRGMRWALAALMPLDRLALKIFPSLRRWTWFGVICMRKKAPDRQDLDL